MHDAATHFIEEVRRLFPSAFHDRKVLEVGSRYINGTVRTLFSKCNYYGLDLSPGPLVDEVCHVADMIGSNAYDTVISCEALEHDARWEESLRAMTRLLKPGGLLVITCAAPGRAEHGTEGTSPGDSPATTDYYKNISEEMFGDVMPLVAFQASEIEEANNDLRFWGVKA